MAFKQKSGSPFQRNFGINKSPMKNTIADNEGHNRSHSDWQGKAPNQWKFKSFDNHGLVYKDAEKQAEHEIAEKTLPKTKWVKENPELYKETSPAKMKSPMKGKETGDHKHEDHHKDVKPIKGGSVVSDRMKKVILEAQKGG